MTNIGLFAYQDMQSLDLIGPLDVFGMANALTAGDPPVSIAGHRT